MNVGFIPTEERDGGGRCLEWRMSGGNNAIKEKGLPNVLDLAHGVFQLC